MRMKGNARATTVARGTPVAICSNGGKNGVMTSLRVAIGVIWVLSFVAGRGLWVSAKPSAITATSAEITAQAEHAGGTVAGGSLMEPDDSSPSNDSRVDLFGNEIEEAVADYRIDLRGGIYERHSPDTEVARLGSPTT
jgi:hypothetical protein